MHNDEDYVEPEPLARRRELPDMIRDLIMIGHEGVTMTLDRNTALNLADDIEFAVRFRKLNKE
jgi:hypothetical protein